MKEHIKKNWFKILVIIILAVIPVIYYQNQQAELQLKREKQENDYKMNRAEFLLEAEKEKRIKEEKELEAEDAKKEYIVKRKKDCYEIEEKEREKWNNIGWSAYIEDEDVCRVFYETDEHKGKDCVEEYGDYTDLYMNCILNVFSKEF